MEKDYEQICKDVSNDISMAVHAGMGFFERTASEVIQIAELRRIADALEGINKSLKELASCTGEHMLYIAGQIDTNN